MPLFRGIIFLYGKTPPVSQADVIRKLSEAAGVDCGAFKKALDEKKSGARLSIGELNALFKEYYAATEQLEKVVDEIKV
jgi:hypothetical protein